MALSTTADCLLGRTDGPGGQQSLIAVGPSNSWKNLHIAADDAFVLYDAAAALALVADGPHELDGPQLTALSLLYDAAAAY